MKILTDTVGQSTHAVFFALEKGTTSSPTIRKDVDKVRSHCFLFDRLPKRLKKSECFRVVTVLPVAVKVRGVLW